MIEFRIGFSVYVKETIPCEIIKLEHGRVGAECLNKNRENINKSEKIKNAPKEACGLSNSSAIRCSSNQYFFYSSS